ncbi:MAG: hypothetical protein ACOCXP_01855 [Candidatus Dojkabacteria bacterium]
MNETALGKLQYRVLLIFTFSLLAFMVTEFLILSTVGTIGPDISNVRTETEKIKLENELLKAEIREHQTSVRVKSGLEETVDMNTVDVVSLEMVGLNEVEIASGQ